MPDKPEFLQEEHLEFLDNLRKSGVTNMFGAAPYLQKAYPELTLPEARKVHIYWMETFGERQKNKPPQETVSSKDDDEDDDIEEDDDDSWDDEDEYDEDDDYDDEDEEDDDL